MLCDRCPGSAGRRVARCESYQDSDQLDHSDGWVHGRLTHSIQKIVECRRSLISVCRYFQGGVVDVLGMQNVFKQDYEMHFKLRSTPESPTA